MTRLSTLFVTMIVAAWSNQLEAFAPMRSYFGVPTAARQPTELHGIVDFLRRPFSGKDDDEENDPVDANTEIEEVHVIDTAPPDAEPKKKGLFASFEVEEAAVCIIGGGVSGLTAAITAAQGIQGGKVILLEASPTLGGRVQSDTTEDGYVLDRGFAVFIEEYPVAKKLLDYDALELGKFLPGALVKLKDDTTLARVSDPFRQPGDIFAAVVAPVGSIIDKIKVLPLLSEVIGKSVEEIFKEKETDTLTCLQERWSFSNDMIEKFYKPFLEGIYLAPLEEQSSRMFHFVFKMFSEGAATLPKGGIGAVSKQLADKATAAGVDIRVGEAVAKLSTDKDGMVLVDIVDGKHRIRAKSVVLATDGKVAQKIMSTVDGFESLETLPETPQRAVGCLYYGFDTKVPVEDPILILSGYGSDSGTEENPVNNVCFPSIVNKGYAPEGCGLCSVTILKDAMEAYHGRDKELDEAVRKELATWFPDQKTDILESWHLKGMYYIPNAQPGQFKTPFAANVNGGRDSASFFGKALPKGLFVCGDHMATATLNGALESGLKAGTEAAKIAK